MITAHTSMQNSVSPKTPKIGPFENLRAFKVDGAITQQSAQTDLLGVSFTQLTREATDTLGTYLRHLLLSHWE